jgi:hypothetical protein
MTLTLIFIFTVAISISFLTVSYRAWQMRRLGARSMESNINYAESFSFRNIEKVMLYWANRTVVGVVGFVVKYWFTITTKTKKWIAESLPKVHKIIEKVDKVPNNTLVKPRTFIRKTILESRAKIRRVREKVKMEHEEKR